MPKLKLTKTSISEVLPTDKIVDYFDTDINGFILRVMPSGIMSYGVIYRNAFKKLRRYTIAKTTAITLLQAKKEAQRLLLLISQGEDIQALKNHLSQDSESKKNYTFKRYLDEFYLGWVSENHRTHSTKITLQSTLNFFNSMYLSEITSSDFNNFLFKYKKEKNVSDATLNKIISVMQGAMSRAVAFGYLESSPLSGFKKYKENESKIRYLSTAETQRLMGILNESDNQTADIITLAYYTGMRRGEIFTLTWQDIDFKLKQIILDKTKTKSGKARCIPMHDKIYNLLFTLSVKSDCDLIFPSEKTGKVLGSIAKSWKTFIDLAEINNFRFHDLRHNFASQLVMKGESLTTVRELLGHSDYKMTLRYAHLAPEHKQKAINLL